MVPGMGRLFRSNRPVPPASASPPLLRDLLQGHPWQALDSYLWSGFAFRFALGYQGPLTLTRPCNLLSACSHCSAVPAAVALGVSRGHTVGLFICLPFRLFHCSPLGAAERSDSYVRLVLDLSSSRGASVNTGIPREELRYGIPPWMRPWPLCTAWGGTRLWQTRTSATPSASALCGPRIGRSCATRGKSGYTSTSGSLLGPALPPSFLLSLRRRFTGLPYTFTGAATSSIISMIISWRGPPMLHAPMTSVSPSRWRSWSC